MAATVRERDPAADDTRERIVHAALEAFAAQGFEGASTRAIATAAAANQGLVTYYFRDKAGLWRAAVERGLADLARDAGPPAPPGAPAFEALLARLTRHASVLRIVMRETLDDGPRLRWLARGPLAQWAARLRAEARAHLGGAAVDDLSDAEISFWAGALVGVVTTGPGTRVLAGVEPDRDATRATLAALFVNALAAPRGGGGDWSLGAARRRRWTRPSQS